MSAESRAAISDLDEFVAQLIHAYKHPAGTGQVCDKCRAVATVIVRKVEEWDL